MEETDIKFTVNTKSIQKLPSGTEVSAIAPSKFFKNILKEFVFITSELYIIQI